MKGSIKKVFYFLQALTLMACNDHEKRDKESIENDKQASAIRFIVGIGKIVPEQDIIQLASPVNGIVQKIYKKENDSVSAGTPVLELEHQLEDAKVDQLRYEVITQLAQIDVDEANVEEYEAKYNNALSEFQRLQALWEKGAETQQAVDNANTTLKSFQANLKRLQATVNVSKGRLNETKAALHTTLIEKDQKTILSPISGKLLELTVLLGSPINTQQSFAQISSQGKIIALCEIDELYAGQISVGQKGWIRNVGSTDTLAIGTVYFTSSFLKKKSLFTDQPEEKEDRRVRTIKILLDQPDKLLLNARIECVLDVSKKS